MRHVSKIMTPRCTKTRRLFLLSFCTYFFTSPGFSFHSPIINGLALQQPARLLCPFLRSDSSISQRCFWPILTFSVIRLAPDEFYVFTTSVLHRSLCPYHCAPLLCTLCFAYDLTYSAESKILHQQRISAYFYLPRFLHSADIYRNLFKLRYSYFKTLYTISRNKFPLYK
jgi:hypothetical protein